MSEAMPGFSPPTSRVRLSFIGAMEEFRAEGRGTATDDTMLGREIRDFGLDWQDPGRFEAYAATCGTRPGRTRPAGPGTCPRPPCGGWTATSTWGGSPSGTGSPPGSPSSAGTSATT